MDMDLINRIIASLKTYVRGIALPGEKPLFIVTPMMVVSANAFTLAFVLTASQVIYTSQRSILYFLFLPLFCLGHSAIWALSMCEHQAIHGNISKRRGWINRVVAELVSILCLAPEPSLYRRTHFEHHKHLATIQDPDYLYLRGLGFTEGHPVEFYYTILWKTIFSPKFYVTNLSARVRGHLFQGPLAHRASFLAWWASIIGAAAAVRPWGAFSMYILLTFIAYALSGLLETVSEHAWGESQPELKSHPRLLPIEANPCLFLLFLYWRACVLGADQALHGCHHDRKQLSLDWPNVAFSPEAQASLRRAKWGIRAHFRASFISLSKAETPN